MNFKEITKVITNNKKPKTKENHVGIELELICFLPRKQLAWEFVKAGLSEYCNVGTDGSIEMSMEDEDRGFHDHEVRIISPESKLEEVVGKTCEILASWGAKVNKSCGMHVHLDMRTRDREKAFNNLVNIQPILYKMNPSCRKTGEYSAPTKSSEYSFFFKKERREQKYWCHEHNNYDICIPPRIYWEYPNGDKYQGVNPHSYSKHKTIEVRIHAGTVDKDKIINWIKLLTTVADHKTKIKKEISSVNELVKEFKLSNDLSAYINNRIEVYKKSRKKKLKQSN